MFAGSGTVVVLAAIYGFFALRFPMALIVSLVALGFVLIAAQFVAWREVEGENK